ncbi:MAG: MFS transporter [bacterium]|nr:MFS transporter [bacterium]
MFFHKKYFDQKLSPGFVALYSGKMLIVIAGGFWGIFLPIFLYRLFDENIHAVVGYYGFSSLIYAVTVAFGGMWINRFGIQRALRLSTFAGALFYLIFYFANHDNRLIIVSLSLLVLTLYRILYWIPYHIDFAKFTNRRQRGRELSFLSVTEDILGIFIPVVAGFLIARFGFDVLFFIAILLYVVSFLPYLTLPKTRESFQWSYRETWKQFFSRGRRRAILAFFADGAESIVGLVVWPIFLFQILQGNYLHVGALSTVVIASTVIIQLFVGKWIDVLHSREERLLHAGSALYAAGWFLKIFIITAFQIFIVSTYHAIAKIVMKIPFDTLTYEVAADEGHYVDEFTVLHEMAIHLGKVGMSLLVIVVAYFFPLQWTFILAAVAAIGLGILRPSAEIVDRTMRKRL